MIDFEELKHRPATLTLPACVQGSHRLEKYLNIWDCLEKSLNILDWD